MLTLKRTRLALPLLLLGSLTAPALADPLAVTFTNSSTAGVTSITATPKGADTPSDQNLLTQSIPAGETATATLDIPPDACLFNLAITFDTGKQTSAPDTDVCNTDAIVLQ